MKDWLPITVRNRVALGFAFAALVMFVTWNLSPDPHRTGHIVATKLWPELFSLSNYYFFFKYPDIEGFRIAAFSISVILNGLLILAIVPFWRILHASNYIRVPLAVLNLVGGLIILWIVGESVIERRNAPYEMFILFLLMALSLLALSTALFIFKNELGLRHELEVKKMMSGGVSR